MKPGSKTRWRKVRDLGFAVYPERGRLGFGVVLVLFSSGVETVQPWLTGKLVDGIVEKHTTAAEIVRFCLALVVVFLVKAVADFLHTYWIARAGQRISHALRSALYAKTVALPIPVYDETPVGKLMTRVINDVRSFAELFTPSMVGLFLDSFVVVFTIGSMVYLAPWLAVATLLPVPLIFVGVLIFGRRVEAAYGRVRSAIGAINGFLGEKLPAIPVIQQLGAEGPMLAAFDDLCRVHERAQKDTVREFAYVQPVANVLHGVSTSILFLYGGYLVVQGRVSVGLLIAFLGYIRNLFQPVRDFVEKYNVFLAAFVAADRMAELIEAPTEASLTTNDYRLGTGVGLERHPLPIEFEDVTFHYPSRPERAIEMVSFAVPAGGSLAIVGPTGSGKSTLTRLLLRFYPTDRGRVRFGGIPVEQWNLAELRRQIAYVPQEVYLFEGTLAENLRFGLGLVSDARLRQACEESFLWEFIAPRGGLELNLEEGGRGLSAGERQLVAFTRILLSDAPVVIFDEATSNLDTVLEDRLLRATRRVMGNRTTLLIAHRPTTLRLCQSVLAIRDGKVAHFGPNSSDLTEALRRGFLDAADPAALPVGPGHANIAG